MVDKTGQNDAESLLPKDDEKIMLLTDNFGPYKFVWHDQFQFDEITVSLTDQLDTEESHKGNLTETEKRYRA